MRRNNFDGIAIVYDRLARIFFGSSLRQAQTHFIAKVPEHAKLLIFGGGTGWIAEEILKISPTLKITMVDASLKMIELARRRLDKKSVDLICSDENQKFKNKFDAIMLPFFIDMFPNEKIASTIEKIKVNLNTNSTWLVIDFVSEQWWHRLYLWIMYRFFKITCSIEAGKLPDWDNQLHIQNILEVDSKHFYKDFIKSSLRIWK